MRRVFEEHGYFAVDVPATDIFETDNEFVLELEVPGFERDELSVEIDGQALVVTGRRAEEEQEQVGRERLLHERLEHSFERRFELPRAVDTEHVAASCDKGVLTVRVPKAEAASAPRTVTIASV